MDRPKRHQDSRDPFDDNEVTGAPPTAELEAVSDGLREILETSYGRAAASVTSHLIEDTLIVLLDDLELLPNEEFLVENGQHDAVVKLRSHYQQGIEPTFRAAVERATGRRVIAFASHITVEEPRFAVEVFRLEPR